MAQSEKPPVFWNPDGYVEVVLEGILVAEQIKKLNQISLAIFEEHGAANLLIDARQGRVGRDAASFSALMKLARERKLKKFFVLVDRNPISSDAGKESGVIISMLTAALGKRPIYMYDEAEARRLAAAD